MSDGNLDAELNRAREEIEALQRRLELLELRVQNIPVSFLMDPIFLIRAFAVVGLHFVGSLIISIFLALLFFLMKL